MAEMDDKHFDCMLSTIECQRIFDNVMRSLDGSLSNGEEKALMQEIKKYPCCLEKMEIAQSFKEFLCSKIDRKEVSPSLVTSIKDKIRQISIQQSA